MKFEYGDTIIEIDSGWVQDCGSDLQIVFIDTTSDTLEISKDNLSRLVAMLQEAQKRLRENNAVA